MFANIGPSGWCFFNRYKNPNRPDNVTSNLLNIILYNNDFTFNDSQYITKQGVTMGQRFAPLLPIHNLLCGKIY